jgi:hypothetical protein
MQQQYAPASGLYSANRPTRDFLITDVGVLLALIAATVIIEHPAWFGA